jgi:hypothetical protein
MTNILTIPKSSIEIDRIIEVTATNIDAHQSDTAIATVKLEATVKCTGDNVVQSNSMLIQYEGITKIDCNFVIKCPNILKCDITSLAVLSSLQVVITYTLEDFMVTKCLLLL